MPHLDLDHAPAKSLQRLCKRQLAAGLRALRGTASLAEVHDLRKRLKLLRSLARLARPALRRRDYAATEKALRRAARALAPARHAEALRETLTDLGAAADAAESAALAAAQALAADSYATSHTAEALGAARSTAREALKAARRAVGNWRFADQGPTPLLAAMTGQYARARKRIRRGLNHHDRATLHDGRTALIRWLHHLHVVTPLWPAVLTPWEQRLDAFRDILGGVNDLDELQAALARGPALAADAAATMARLIDRRRDGLLAAARAGAAELLTERPRDFHRRMAAIWRAVAR